MNLDDSNNSNWNVALEFHLFLENILCAIFASHAINFIGLIMMAKNTFN
jgi:hypothetical protein